MNEIGWFKFWRKALSRFVGDSEGLHIWIYLLNEALIDDGKAPLKKQNIKLNRGQLALSVATIKAGTQINTSVIRRSLKKLENEGNIDIQTSKQGTIITIVNYDKYQSTEQTIDKQHDKRSTNNRQTIDKQSTNNRQYIRELRIENKESENSEPPSRCSNLTTKELFDLWNSHIGKKLPDSICFFINSDLEDRIAEKIKMHPNKIYWEQVFEKVLASDWLSGRSPSKDGTVFKITFPWFLSRLERISAGEFENMKKTKEAPRRKLL